MRKLMSAGELRGLGMTVPKIVPDRAEAMVQVTIAFPADRKMRMSYELVSPFEWANEWSADWPDRLPGGEQAGGSLED